MTHHQISEAIRRLEKMHVPPPNERSQFWLDLLLVRDAMRAQLATFGGYYVSHGCHFEWTDKADESFGWLVMKPSTRDAQRTKLNVRVARVTGDLWLYEYEFVLWQGIVGERQYETRERAKAQCETEVVAMVRDIARSLVEYCNTPPEQVTA